MVKHKIFKLIITAIVVFLSFSTMAQGLTFGQIQQGQTQGQVLGASTTGLVGYWNFDEGSGTTAADSSGNGHNATLNGATWTTGKVGSGALSFNGTSSYASISGMSPLTGDFSIALWVKPNDTTKQSYISDFAYSNDVALIMGYQPGYYNIFNGNYPCSGNAANSQMPITGAGVWDLVTWIKSGTTLIGYVNGVQKISCSITITGMSPSSSLQIGRTYGASNYFAGSVDEYRIYNRALSAQEVTDIYNYTGTTSTNPPVISNITSSGITASAATITWVTDISSDSQVDYGTTTSYGSSSALNSSLTTTHTITLSSLSPSTLYHYRVKSIDASGNLAVSADNTFTTTATPPADTTAPTVPSGLTATAVSSSGINLSWTASTDNVAVIGYTIYRGGVQIGTSVTNSYSDTGLSPSTSYTYTVDAFDAAGNHSAQSTSASATTQAQSTGTNCSTTGIRCVGPGQQYATIQACATAMQPGDTCVVFAGTYNENVTVPAGTAGNYKTITVNGSDVVTVKGFILNSHTKLIGNCPQSAAINTCGFNIQNPSSPNSSMCVAVPSGSTDIYIRDNVMYACGSGAMAGVPGTTAQVSASYVYFQGNTLSYACVTQATAGPSKDCDSLHMTGNHWLVENNDISHYTLGFYFSDSSYNVIRNNIPHDQYETEAAGNAHTDAFYASTDSATNFNVIEGNYQHTGVGPNAKGLLTQDYCGCSTNVIYRYNTVSNIGSGNTSTYGWNNQKMYNNTYLNISDFVSSNFGADGFYDLAGKGSANGADLNEIYYWDYAITGADPLFLDTISGATGTWGHNLGYCNAAGASNCVLYGHSGGGSFTTDSGNIYGYQNHVPTNNPNFVNFAGSDFHLQSGSPAIAAGTYLTTVASGDTGSGTTLVVNDASYFQDGYGLSNTYSTVYPDCIAVGTAANHVCITAVNYTTNTLTLASPIIRSAGQGVYLYSKSDGTVVLTSANPDMGAFPYTGTQSPPPADTTSPSVPSGISASAVSSSAINISWSASTDVDNTSSQLTYKVFRNGTQVGATAAGVTSYSDTALSAGTTYNYTVSASDPAGNSSAQSSPSVPATTQSGPDTTAPTVSITSPANNASVSGTITVSANASDPVVTGQTTSGLSLVTVSIDGSVFVTSTSGTLSKPLDTTTLTNSSHTITAIAKDNAGNTSTTATVTITVSNASATKFPRLVTLTSLEGLSAIPANTTITATVLSPSSGSSLETQSNLTATANNYTVSFLSSDPQLVNIRIKVNGYLSQLLTNVDTTVNSSVALSVPQLLAGDSNNDNTINSLDYSLLNSNYNQTFALADFNGDGLVNSLDYAILKNNYGKSGQ